MIKKKDLFLNFYGQLVTMTTNLSVNSSETSVNSESLPIFYEGILIDSDNDYYYLGRNINEINQAVRKTNVVHVMLFEELDQYEEFLKGMPGPQKNEDIN